MYTLVPEIPPWGQTFAEFLTQSSRACLHFWVITKTWGFFPPPFLSFSFRDQPKPLRAFPGTGLFISFSEANPSLLLWCCLSHCLLTSIAELTSRGPMAWSFSSSFPSPLSWHVLTLLFFSWVLRNLSSACSTSVSKLFHLLDLRTPKQEFQLSY